MNTEVRELDMGLYEDAIGVYGMGDKKIIIKHDEYTDDPLSWGHFEFFSTHKRYYTDSKYKAIKAKDGSFWGIEDFDSLEEIQEFLTNNDYLFNYVYLYEHSGFRIWTSTEKQYPNSIDMFFDSGCFGFLYVSKDKVRREYGVKKISPKVKKQVYDFMSGFVQNEWEQYFNGEVYEYLLLDKNDVYEECLGGFYGLEGLREHLNSELKIQMPII
ncbi:hypothetical protein [Helicobacter cappadocius]|uniref:Uncharacterized protein n=1 Tax=Helicobacter cappadocius TaxID=3063998 RepID=A0AA90PYC9_9HELI|nr:MULTISPECIES: hypothetical protein [unclassified Helicobacter]MDO7253056.1 hypothetical protein [Helicobacter sp. faydin-H75]MDP2538818.1 hypothetical protein [Helicobacter sp. faydin-H76]